MDTMKTLAGIVGYAPQCEELLEVIRQHGGTLTQDEFDKEFGDYIKVERDWTEEEIESGEITGVRCVERTRNKRRFPITPETGFILGDRRSRHWGKWLHLLQLMAEIGVVAISGTAPNVAYSEIQPKGAKT